MHLQIYYTFSAAIRHECYNIGPACLLIKQSIGCSALLFQCQVVSCRMFRSVNTRPSLQHLAYQGFSASITQSIINQSTNHRLIPFCQFYSSKALFYLYVKTIFFRIFLFFNKNLFSQSHFSLVCCTSLAKKAYLDWIAGLVVQNHCC